MKKFIPAVLISLCSVILSTSLITAAPARMISLEEARIVAKNFYYERISQIHQVNFETLELKNVVTIKKDGKPLYYTININEGFVVVSAWENVQPVLAYSLEESFSTPEKEENFKAWMNQYEVQIYDAIEKEFIPTPEISTRWKKYSDPNFQQKSIDKLRDIEPMLTSKWDQGKYYNEMCPADPAGPAGHCYTGCVATAMGQLAYYFRYPETGTGSYSYYHSSYDTISANFGNTTYRWDEMTNTLNESNLAAAELLFHLGVSVDMVYGPNGSGMYNHKAAYSLRTFFKYAPETQYLFRDSTTLNWDSVVIAHLERKIPMYYAGWSVPNINGHAFIVDGCQGTDFFHFNWGWSGSYDGYFYLDQLNPGGSNFNLAQELVINCFPDTNQYSYPDYCSGYKHFTSFNGTFDDGSGPAYNYQPNSQCSYLIDPQSEMDSVTSVTLSFQRFDLTANEDFFMVYDGEDAGAPLIATLTGNELPGDITSAGNKMFVVFQSGNPEGSGGFFASYSSNRPVWCSGMTVLNGQTDELSDGSYSFYYQNNSTCMWQILPPGAGSVTLFFTKFDTESDHDLLKVYDLATSSLLATISGHYDAGDPPPPVTSPSGKMFLTFTTNSTVRADGWDAWYLASPVGIDDNENSMGFSIYPNPAKDELILNFNQITGEVSTIEIYNCFNRLISKRNFTSAEGSIKKINVSGLNAGLYFIRVENGDFIYVKKIVVQR